MKILPVSEMRFFSLFWAVAALFFSHVAFAAPAPPATDPTPEERAAQIKAEADAASDAHHYDDAIAGYTKAYSIFPDPALLYNRSRAHEARGEYPEAFEDLDAFANSASPELRKKIPRLTELLVQLRLKITTLELSCNVSGARVLLDGHELGTTPLPPTKVNAGSATLEIVAEGDFPYKRTIDLKGGGSISVDATLNAKASFGVLSVATTPAGATLTVDDKSFGAAPTEGTIPVGTHAVVAHLDGHQDVTTRVVIEAGQRRGLDLTLPPKKTILSSPFFWGAVGVVLAATVVVISVAALTEKSAGNGDGFTPSQVSGPLLKW